MSNIFEIAARSKVRFTTSKGLLTVEDLWDLPLTSTTNRPNLDDIARELHNASQATTVSFVNKSTASDTTAKLKFDIVKHIIDTKLSEADTSRLARERKEKRDQIMELINRKENEKLSDSSIDDLRKMLDSL